MDPNNRPALKQAARDALSQASYDPKKLVLIHSGAAVLLSLLVTLINYLLDLKISQSTGLSGMDTVATLSTMQSLLTTASNLLLPFWGAGFLFVTLGYIRHQEVGPASLLEGFRRFGPVFRYTLLQGLLQIGIGILTFTVSMQLFLMTPLSNGLFELAQSLPQQPVLADGTPVLDPAMQSQAIAASAPLMILFGTLFIAGTLYLSYHLRLGLFILFDEPGTGAFAALRGSRIQMKGHKKKLLMLDLSFWWYYLLQALIIVAAYIPYFLALLGKELSFGMASILFMVISLGGQLVLSLLAKNQVDTTYAAFYLATKPKPDVQNGI